MMVLGVFTKRGIGKNLFSIAGHILLLPKIAQEGNSNGFPRHQNV